MPGRSKAPWICVALLATMTHPRAPAAANATAMADQGWPSWRGEAGDGTSPEPIAVSTWNPAQNIVWQATVPGRGHASPIVSGNQVYVATADEQAQTQLVLAYDKSTGKQIWSTVAHKSGFIGKHNKNTHASATCCCDGEQIYSAFVNRDALRVTAMDLSGKIAWQAVAGNFGSEHGYGSSPVLHNSLVIVLGDNLKNSFIAALDAKTGRIVWRTDRKTTGKHGSYATPVVGQVAGKSQLLVSGMDSTSSYDPDTGQLIWTCDGPAEVTACTPAFSDKLVFSSGGYPQKELLAIRADGTGNITRSHVVWRTAKGVTYVPSPLYHNGRLYVVSDNGVTTCFIAATGKQVWLGRLDGNFSASLVLAGNLLLVTNEAGRTYVLKTGNKFEVIAQNDLRDGGFASPALSGGQIFLRTDHNLYCIGSTRK